MRRRLLYRLTPLAVLASAAASSTCGELDPIAPETCGNLVLECSVPDGTVVPAGIGHCESFKEEDQDENGDDRKPYLEDCDTVATVDGSPCPPFELPKVEGAFTIAFEPCERQRCIPLGEPNACRFSCATAPPPDPEDPLGEQRLENAFLCPEGFGCGSDQLCRRPSGRFAAAADLGVLSGSWLGMADFDGDGRDDFATATPGTVTVHYMDDRARVAQSYEIKLPLTGNPAIGQLTETQLLDAHALATRPRVRRARAGIADLIAPSEQGLFVLRGSEQRELLPTIYFFVRIPLMGSVPEDDYRIVAFDALPTVFELDGELEFYAGDETVLAGPNFDDPQSGKYAFSIIPSDGSQPVSVYDLEANPASLRAFTGADLDGAGSEELVIAFNGADNVKLAQFGPPEPDPEQRKPFLVPVTVGEVALDDGAVVTTGGAVVAQVNGAHAGVSGDTGGAGAEGGASGGGGSAGGGGDGSGDGGAGPCAMATPPSDEHPDLLIAGCTVALGNDGKCDREDTKIFVAYGTGDATSLHSDPFEADGADGDNLARLAVAYEACDGFPLAAGDVDGDGELDLVMADGLWLSSDIRAQQAINPCAAFCATEPTIAAGSSLEVEWSEARLGDFNGDGLVDVVAAFDGAPGLAFFLATSSGALNPAPVISPFRASLLTVGDFDGNGVDDLVFAEEVPDGDSLSIFFGEANQAPASPLSLGILDELLQITAGESASPGQHVADGITDLLVGALTTDDTGAPAIGFVVLIGKPDQQLFSPYPLQSDDAMPDAQAALAVAVDEFGFASGDPPLLPNVVAIAAPPAMDRFPSADVLPFGISVGGDAQLTTIPASAAPAMPLASGSELGALLGSVAYGASGIPVPVALIWDAASPTDANLAILPNPSGVGGVNWSDAPHFVLSGYSVTGAKGVAGATTGKLGCGADFGAVLGAYEEAHNEIAACRLSPSDSSGLGGGESLLVQLVHDDGEARNDAYIIAADVLEDWENGEEPSEGDLIALRPKPGSDGELVATVGAACLNLDGDPRDEVVLAVLHTDCEKGTLANTTIVLERWDFEDATPQEGVAIPGAVIQGDDLLIGDGRGLPHGIVIGDVNADGITDLVVGGRRTSMLLLGEPFAP